MDYGTDLLLADDDLVFTADGDVEVVSGPAMVAQDIDQTLKATPGSLYWDREAGSTVLFMLNNSDEAADAVIAELERAAMADPRVNPESVQAYQTGPGKFRLEFAPVKAVKPETLDVDLTKGGKA